MLSMRVEATAGDDVNDCARQMVTLALRTGIAIDLRFNGVEMTAYPHGDAELLAGAYRMALLEQREFATAWSDGTHQAWGKSTKVKGAV